MKNKTNFLCTQDFWTPLYMQITNPFLLFHQDRCTLGRCFWWLAGWRGCWGLHPHCPLSWSCYCCLHCSCHTRQTSRTNLFSSALSGECAQPTRRGERSEKCGEKKERRKKVKLMEEQRKTRIKAHLYTTNTSITDYLWHNTAWLIL